MATLVKDMTHGRETPLLLRFMLPMLLGNLFQQVYNLADSIIVGQHEGANALGSIGCIGSFTFLFFSFCTEGFETFHFFISYTSFFPETARTETGKIQRRCNNKRSRSYQILRLQNP